MKPFNLEEYLANPSRKVVTGTGKNVRIICTDAKISDFHSIITLVEELNGNESIVTYTNEGHYYSCEPSKVNDLFFAPEKHEGWVNVYKSESDRSLGMNIWQTKEEAKKWVGAADYVTTVKIEWEE